MFELVGKHGTAKVFATTVEESATAQIIELLNQPLIEGSMVRIMPDVHAGKGCTIGTTLTVKDSIVPNLVGVDIGCGMLCLKLEEKDLNLEILDQVIKDYVPSGFNVRRDPHLLSDLWVYELKKLYSNKVVDVGRAVASVGTLGGGNHFIEVNKDDYGNLYLVIHSGSRNLGNRVAQVYQELAYKEIQDHAAETVQFINDLKANGRQHEISDLLKQQTKPKVKKELAYLVGDHFNHYLHDMSIVQRYADHNRKAMAHTICQVMGLSFGSKGFTTVHNYIDLETMILRKGAVSAKAGEELLIPINMRDGSLICVGKGNPDWNQSAPHGAGRLMSRSAAKAKLSLDQFHETMKGIYSTTIGRNTLDEAPAAYKPMQEILDNIGDTVTVTKHITPIYNFKAGGD